MILSEFEKDTYREKIRARGNFKPVAYITGLKSFYHWDFQVNENVLIPRPETEELLEWVLKENRGVAKKVLDLCCGSGCIGISLLKEELLFQLSFSDISEKALEVTKNNLRNLVEEKKEFQLFQSDLYRSIPEQKFDVIVSNPPYIPLEEKSQIMPDVLNYEPHIALFLQEPEAFHKRLLEESLNFLSEEGKLYLETHPDWIQKIVGLGKELGYKNIQIKQDLSRKERFISLEK